MAKKKKIAKLVQGVNPVTLDLAPHEVGILTGTMNIGCCSIVILWDGAEGKSRGGIQRYYYSNHDCYEHVRGQRTGGAPLDWEALLRDVPNDENTVVLMSCLRSDYTRHIHNLYRALEKWNLGKVQCNVAPHSNVLVLRDGRVQEISSTSRKGMTSKLETNYAIRNKNAKTRFQ